MSDCCPCRDHLVVYAWPNTEDYVVQDITADLARALMADPEALAEFKAAHVPKGRFMIQIARKRSERLEILWSDYRDVVPLESR